MAKTKVEEWDETAANNTDLDGIATAPNSMLPSDARKFAQEIMSQVASWVGADTIASAATTDLGSVLGRYVEVTGTTSITGFGTIKAGTVKFLKFTGALTLTHNATSLFLPGAANITTAAGDTAIFVSEGSGNWRCLMYQRALGTRGQAWEQIGAVRNDSGVAEIEWTDLSAYRLLRISGAVTPASAAVNILMEFSTDDGANYIGADYGRLASTTVSSPAGTNIQNDVQAAALLNTPVGLESGVSLVISQLEIFNFNQSSVVFYHYKTSFINSGAGLEYMSVVSGRNTGTTARDALRIRPSSGNISANGLVLEGVRG